MREARCLSKLTYVQYIFYQFYHKMKKKFLSAMLLATIAISSAWSATDYGLPEGIQEGNILHCFNWTIADIRAELPNIAEAGFGSIQLSPMQRNAAKGVVWADVYRPYDFKFIANGMGTANDLKTLCQEAEAYGIKIIVDVVANHVDGHKASGNLTLYHDSWWNSNGRLRWNGSVDYGNRYSITHNQMGGGDSYPDVNSEDTEVQNRAKTYIEELKSLGVKGIRWDAAKHIALPSESCQFWATVTSVPGMYHYGEVLDNPGGGNADALMKEYTSYMSVTDNGYGEKALQGNGVPSSHAGWAAGSLADTKVVYWGESHDTYSNNGGSTKNVSQEQVDRAYAIVACRNGATALYFSRPSAKEFSSIKIGTKGSTHFTSKQIAEVNKFRNAMVGKADYFSSGSGVASVTRKDGGAVIVATGGNRSVSVANGGGYCPAGTYTDRVSGQTFTVTATTISGQVGPSGIAVIYGDIVRTPSVSFTPDGGSFRSETQSVTATLKNAVSGWVKVGNSSRMNFSGNTMTFSVGADMAYGETVSVSWGATGEDSSENTGSVSFTKLDPAAVTYVYYNNPNGWSAVSCYIYKPGTTPQLENGAWPGKPMAKMTDGSGLWRYEVPENLSNGTKVIFNNNNNGSQYPQDVPGQSCGLDLAGASMICEGTDWKEYNPQPQPERGIVTANPASGTTFTENITVTLSVTPAATIHYTTDGSTPTTASATYSSPLTFTQTTTLRTLSVTSAGVTNLQEFSYRKVSQPQPGGARKVYYYGDWSNIKIYLYIKEEGTRASTKAQENATWPGASMTRNEDGVWEYDVPEGMENALAIYYSSATNRYPADQEDGMPLEGKSKVFFSDTKDFDDYDKTVTVTYDGTWNPVNVYLYNNDNDVMATWPGKPMYKKDEHTAKYLVPERYNNAYVIFNSNGQQFPASGETGLKLPGESMTFYHGENTWNTPLDQIDRDMPTNITVTPGYNAITISGLNGQQVIIAGMDGKIYGTSNSAHGEIEAYVTPGIYIVNINGRSLKIAVR